MKRLLCQIAAILFPFCLLADAEPAKDKADEKTTDKSEDKKDDKKDDKADDKKPSDTQSGNSEAEKTVKIGNLSFPVAQQPTPLISFGQNVLDKKQMQLIVAANQFKNTNGYFITVAPQLVYGFTDEVSGLLTTPCAVRYREGPDHTSGCGDTFFQLEYAFYTKAYRTYYDQATIVANVGIPTGSVRKNPPTGFGSNSFFIGYTFSRMEIDWFYFTSQGATITGCSHRTKIGNIYLYQCGVGRRIANSKEWLFDWMVEITGTYAEKDRILGKQNPDSGGNVIIITPSLFLSSAENLIVQLGAGFPLQQNLHGHQDKNQHVLNLQVEWTF